MIFPVHDLAGLLNQPQNGVGGHALAASALADDGQDPAALQIEGDPVDRRDFPFFGVKIGLECLTSRRASAESKFVSVGSTLEMVDSDDIGYPGS